MNFTARCESLEFPVCCLKIKKNAPGAVLVLTINIIVNFPFIKVKEFVTLVISVAWS